MRQECPQCHGATETCSDHSLLWYPQRTICYMSMERRALEWRYDELHADAPFHDGTFPEDPSAWSAHRTTNAPYHYLDGVNLWVSRRDLTPDDHFLGAPHGEEDD